MNIRGLHQADRVSRLERVPVLGSTDNFNGGTMLSRYSPRAIEDLLVSLDNIFQMLDDANGLECLTRLYHHKGSLGAEAPLVNPKALECLVPGALDRLDIMNYTILRGIVPSYIQAKRSPDPSDVDVGE